MARRPASVARVVPVEKLPQDAAFFEAAHRVERGRRHEHAPRTTAGIAAATPERAHPPAIPGTRIPRRVRRPCPARGPPRARLAGGQGDPSPEIIRIEECEQGAARRTDAPIHSCTWAEPDRVTNQGDPAAISGDDPGRIIGRRVVHDETSRSPVCDSTLSSAAPRYRA